MGVYNATIITNAGQNLIASAIAGGEAVNFSSVKTSTHVYPAGTSLQNLTALDDVKQSVSPTSVDVYNNNIVQVSARVPNTGIATAYLINTIGLFGQVSGGTETLIAVLTASTPDEVPVFDPESPAAFIFNVQMTIQNADTVTFEVNDSGTATVADLNRVAQPFSGATASAAGTVGRVPAPAAGADGKFLRGDATWAAPADMVENFASSDVADGSATDWTSVIELDSGETNASIFAKMSQMFKNIRYLYKMLGTTDISAIGNGTVTNALSVLNANGTYALIGYLTAADPVKSFTASTYRYLYMELCVDSSETKIIASTFVPMRMIDNRTVASDIIMQGTRVLSGGATFSAGASVKVSKNMIQLTSPYSNTWTFYRIQCYGIK